MSRLHCLNPCDPQSKRRCAIDGLYRTLDAGNGAGGQAHGICYAIDQQGGKTNCGYSENVMMTLCSDSHGTPHAVCYGISRSAYTGGMNAGGMPIGEDIQPCLQANGCGAVVYAIEGNTVDRASGKNGSGVCCDVSPTLNTQDRHAVCFSVDALSSNSMKSSNPHSGFHETNVSKCLDTGCCEPSCNQGGVMVCYRRKT